MNNLACITVEHDVEGMAVSQSDDVPHDGHDCKAAREARPALEPLLAGNRPLPEDILEIVARKRPLDFPKDLYLLVLAELIVILADGEADVVLESGGLFDIAAQAVALPVLDDDIADGVAVLDPGDDADFEVDGRDGVALDGVVFLFGGAVEHLVDEGKQLHDPFVQPQVLLALEQVVVVLAVGAHHHELLGPLLGADDHDLVLEVIDGDILDVGSVAAKEAHVGLLNPRQLDRGLLEVNHLDEIQGLLGLAHHLPDEFDGRGEVEHLVQLLVNRQVLHHSNQRFLLVLNEPELALRTALLVLLENLLAEFDDALADLHLHACALALPDLLEDLRHEDEHLFAQLQGDLAQLLHHHLALAVEWLEGVVVFDDFVVDLVCVPAFELVLASAQEDQGKEQGLGVVFSYVHQQLL